MHRVSVILPVYNGAKYIERCVMSVLCQTYKDFELIIINDGSIDETDMICVRLVEKDSRIIYVKQSNEGVSVSRNRGIDLATGTYLTFIDCDDLYPINRLEELVFKMDMGYDMVYCNFYEIGNNDRFERNSIKDEEKRKSDMLDFILFNDKVTAVWRTMMRIDLAKKIKFNKLKYAEDLFYVLNYISKCDGKILVYDKPLYFYDRNDNSVSLNTKSKKYIDDFINIPIFMAKFLEENNLMSKKYKKKLTSEYAYAIIRIRKCTKYKEFKKVVSNNSLKKILNITVFDKKEIIKSIIVFFAKIKFWFLFRFIK